MPSALHLELLFIFFWLGYREAIIKNKQTCGCVWPGSRRRWLECRGLLRQGRPRSGETRAEGVLGGGSEVEAVSLEFEVGGVDASHVREARRGG